MQCNPMFARVAHHAFAGLANLPGFKGLGSQSPPPPPVSIENPSPPTRTLALPPSEQANAVQGVSNSIKTVRWILPNMNRSGCMWQYLPWEHTFSSPELKLCI
jgi:hypothetical protein